MGSWFIVAVIVVGLIVLARYVRENRTAAQARSQAMSLQGEIWKVIGRIRRSRSDRPNDVPKEWLEGYEALFKEHGGIPGYSPDDEYVDWEECRGVLLAAHGRLLEFEARLRHDMAAVEKARRDNPTNLRRLESLVAEVKQLPRVDLRKVDHVEGLLALAKVNSTRVDAESALITAANLAAGLEEIRPLLPQAAP